MLNDFRKQKTHLLFTGLSALIILAVSGCFGDGMVNVSGKVTVDGAIVESGSIAFAPADGKTAVEGAVIEDGQYRAKVPPGDKIIRIRGMKLEPTVVYDEVSRTKHESHKAIRVTDAKYESKDSPLKVTITKTGEVHDFDLPSMEKEKKP